MKQKHLKAFMKSAEAFAECSTARRLQVGAVVVKDNRIISIGYNGTPSGWDNNCEDEMTEFQTFRTPAGETEMKLVITGELRTKPEVLHAETNAIAKLAQYNGSGDGAVLFVTHSPCGDCAKLVLQSGISSVYYRHNYRDSTGVDFLTKAGVKVEQI
jgi:dCMP deaminase